MKKNYQDIKSNYYNQKYDDYDEFYQNYINEVSSEIYRPGVYPNDDDYEMAAEMELAKNHYRKECESCKNKSSNSKKTKTK